MRAGPHRAESTINGSTHLPPPHPLSSPPLLRSAPSTLRFPCPAPLSSAPGPCRPVLCTLLQIEDIIDSGHTAVKLLEHYRAAGAASVKLVSLLDKPSRRQVGRRCECNRPAGLARPASSLLPGRPASARRAACVSGAVGAANPIIQTSMVPTRLLCRLLLQVAAQPDYCCFEIPDAFVVGYGLDFDEEYRSLPYVGVLKPERYTSDVCE